jgi:AcrR family transcriptional regulator
VATGVMDGRRARGERTRQRIIEALISLVDEGDHRPSAQRIATEAGVALRTVYHHFADVEALRASAVQLHADRLISALPPLDAAAPVEQRVSALLRQFGRLYESLTPVLLAATLDESSTATAAGIRATQDSLRKRVAQVFAPEIAARGSERGVLLDGLDSAASWHTWHFLRFDLQRSQRAATRVLELTLRSLLAA